MLHTVITALIALVVLAIAVYLILWVLEAIGIAIPPKIMQLIWVLVVLIALLWLLNLLGPSLHISRYIGAGTSLDYS
jgi:hypothetical protein